MALVMPIRIVRHAGSAMLAALLCCSPLHAQTASAGSKLEYETVSVKPNNSGSAASMSRGTGDGLDATNFTLMMLLMSAYGTRPEQVMGAPGWAKTSHFDIIAKVAGSDAEQYRNLNSTEWRRMMRTLLEDRFKLKAHIEMREMPIYELVLAKGGTKLVEDTTSVRLEPGQKPQPGVRYSGSMSAGRGMFNGTGVTLNVMTSDLASELQRSVVDKTGLTGKYNIALKWAPDDAAGAASGTDTGPSIFTAIQEQLGLKLQPAKGPVETLVIDHVEIPTEN